jgi:hypothetical protein
MIGKAAGRRAVDILPRSDRLNEVAKALAKHGTDGIQPRISELGGYGKSLADPRLTDVVRPPFQLDVGHAVKELATDRHLRYDYLTNLLSKMHRKDEVRALIRYVRSAAAGNLSPDQRAHLLIAALEKLKYIDIVAQFFH